MQEFPHTDPKNKNPTLSDANEAEWKRVTRARTSKDVHCDGESAHYRPLPTMQQAVVGGAVVDTGLEYYGELPVAR